MAAVFDKANAIDGCVRSTFKSQLIYITPMENYVKYEVSSGSKVLILIFF